MIKQLSEEIKNELIEIRRYLHKNPELGLAEYKTSDYIKLKLTEYGILYEECFKTGIKAYINEGKAPTVLLRADMDALPLCEETKLSFASENTGVMHACGHDFHVSCLLGAAKILKSISDKLNGRIILIFQPDEEGNGGAAQMIEKGAANNINAAFALHIEPFAPVGTVQLKNGTIMASPDDFSLLIKGRGGHGATPGQCINPIKIGCEIASAYEAITEKSDFDECVVSVCTFNGGTESPNIIPDSVRITGTARSLNPDIRKRLQMELNTLAKNICSKYGAEFKLQYNLLFPPLINDTAMNELVYDSCKKLGINAEFLDKPSMLGDDFSYFAEIVPSSYFRLGVGCDYPLHSSKLNPNEAALSVGAAIMAQCAVDYIESTNGGN